MRNHVDGSGGLSRRTALAAGLGVTVGVANGLLGTPVARADDGPSARSRAKFAHRAQDTYAALLRHYYDPATSFFLEEFPRTGGNPWSYVWPFSQALIGTQLLSGIPGIGGRYRDDLADRYTALEAYWNRETTPPGYDSYLRPPLGQGGDKFYDDNEWLALAFLQRHYLTPGGDRAAIRRAAEIFDLLVFGWDTDPTHPLPGGVFWTQAPWSNDRNTVSNAPGAEVGLHLYLLTGRRYYLDWATRMYDWVRTNMLAPNGLYWDHVDLAGVIEQTQWTYNQGVMIGAGALLYRATGRRAYLEHALDTATRALAYYAEEDRYFTQPRFTAILFANLLLLSTVVPNPVYRATLEWFADESRRRFRDPATGIYHFFPGSVSLLEQSAMIRVEAMLAWDRADYRKLT
ncbi:MAG TPA: glycoside hydrolase family 76 protein [Actinophytocola sp.]|uniref:glycoside hydrolase family 76 protein n=1 Tax=Actinophytocola sp. TaxID=1872138 RepID=UPI002DBD1FF1|nr:glycoside hydrolase family 76 protein [Actinophytocola sp.]HEU5473717.1 glycoside hydrolase family 76 protein [Actinophytocola sp.]